MHYLARLLPANESTTEMRALVCIECGDAIVTAAGLMNEDARAFTTTHYQRHDLTHNVGPELRVHDLVIAPRDAALDQSFPDSLVFVVRGTY
jgi:hypothetical protein